MARTIALLVLPALLLACGEKKPPTTDPGSASAVSSSTKVPGDAKSRAFAERILKYPLRDFRPADGGEADFVWRVMTFNPDNTFVAAAELLIPGGESFTCEERGAWSMDAAESESVAAMTWSIQKTTCTGRKDGVDLRAQVTVSASGEYKIVFR